MSSFSVKQTEDAKITRKEGQSTKLSQTCFFNALEVHAKFQHYRSENYAQAVQSASCTSVKSEAYCREFSPLKSNLPGEKSKHLTSFSRSVPSSPKQIHISQKSSTLPSTYVSGVRCSDSSSSSIANFLKKLSPKFHKNWSQTKTKPWIVIEFADNDLKEDSLQKDQTESLNHGEFPVNRRNISNSSRNLNKLDILQSRTIHEAKSDSDSLYVAHQSTKKIHGERSVSLHAISLKSEGSKEDTPKSKSPDSYKNKIALTKKSIFSKLTRKKPHTGAKYETNQSGSACLIKAEDTSRSEMDIPAVEVHAPKDYTENLDQEDVVCLQEYTGKSIKQKSTCKSLSMTSLKDDAAKQGINILLTVPETSIHPRKAQPPQTLNLRSKIFVCSPQADRVARKMASVESIGSCSLDVDGSESSCTSDMKDEVTMSEKTLKSCSAILSSCSSPNDVGGLNESNGTLSREEKRSSDGSATQLSKRYDSEEKQECTVAEIKLPSYVSISCAINGYTSYGRFCRSRDNSPARFPSSSSPMKNWETTHSPKSYNSSPLSMADRTAEANGKICYKESKEMLIGKKLEIPVINGSATQMPTNISRTGVNSYDVTDRAVNGYSEEKGILLETLQEIGGASTKHKSLVMQRIESLYGHTTEVCKIPHRNSRLGESAERNNHLMKRSPSCPPQTVRTRSKSPPVFRHLTKDFRDQLRENGLISQSPLRNGKELVDAKGLSSDNSSSTIIPSSVPKSDLSQLPPSSPTPNDEFDKDGHYFLSQLEAEKYTIGQHIAELEKYLDDTNIPEDVCGKIRSAIGKASLLLSQKFEQFRKLCEKNINKNGEPIPTSSDLEGFWDLVLLQVTDVKNTFSEINRIKENNWQEIISPKKTSTRTKVRKRGPPGISISNPSTPNRSSKSSELAKAREEARKKLMEAKRKGRQQNAAQESEAEVSIFVPHSTNGH